MYLLCSDWSIRSLEEKEKKEKEKEENCHLLITTCRTDAGRDKKSYKIYRQFVILKLHFSWDLFQYLKGSSNLICKMCCFDVENIM